VDKGLNPPRHGLAVVHDMHCIAYYGAKQRVYEWVMGATQYQAVNFTILSAK
jgi:hypothetical protein